MALLTLARVQILALLHTEGNRGRGTGHMSSPPKHRSGALVWGWGYKEVPVLQNQSTLGPAQSLHGHLLRVSSVRADTGLHKIVLSSPLRGIADEGPVTKVYAAACACSCLAHSLATETLWPPGKAISQFLSHSQTAVPYLVGSGLGTKPWCPQQSSLLDSPGFTLQIIPYQLPISKPLTSGKY